MRQERSARGSVLFQLRVRRLANFLDVDVEMQSHARQRMVAVQRHDLIYSHPTFVAGIIAIVLALLTVSSQAIKVAKANPIKALKYE